MKRNQLNTYSLLVMLLLILGIILFNEHTITEFAFLIGSVILTFISAVKSRRINDACEIKVRELSSKKK